MGGGNTSRKAQKTERLSTTNAEEAALRAHGVGEEPRQESQDTDDAAIGITMKQFSVHPLLGEGH